MPVGRVLRACRAVRSTVRSVHSTGEAEYHEMSQAQADVQEHILTKYRLTAPRGLGLLVILAYALYGAYIASLYVRTGDKGGMRSADFLLFAIAVLLLMTTDLWRQLVSRTLRGGVRTLLLALFSLIAVKLLLAGGGTQVFNLGQLVTVVGKYFFVGFVAFAALRSRVYPLSRVAALTAAPAGRQRLAIVSTAVFLLAMLSFLAAFVGSPLASLTSFAVISNDYYQDFGDYVTIAYCCLVALQVSYVASHGGSLRAFGLFAGVLLVQAGLVFITAQAVNSNKAVVAVALVSAAALYACWPKGRAVTAGVAVAAAVVVLVLAARLALDAAGVPSLDVTQFRIFDYGDGAFYENTSMLSRWEQFRELGKGQLLGAPVFGDISITSYLHSSVLSVQTHLGLVGSVLFWSFILLQLRQVGRHGGNDGLPVIAVPLLFVSAISSFFSWGPLWFVLGGLYEYLPSSTKPAETRA